MPPEKAKHLFENMHRVVDGLPKTTETKAEKVTESEHEDAFSAEPAMKERFEPLMPRRIEPTKSAPEHWVSRVSRELERKEEQDTERWNRLRQGHSKEDHGHN